jgi:hypothetical protein
VYGFLWLVIVRWAGIDDAGDESATFNVESLLADLRLVLTHRELQLVVVIGTMYLLINHGVQS